MSKIISKIQFIIYSFFAFIFSIIIITYASLSYGISIPLIVLPQFKAEQLYIKLDKKLIFEAKRIDVTISNDEIQETPLLDTPKITPILDFVRTNFSKIKIEALYLNQDIVTFSYMDKPLAPIDNSVAFVGKGIDSLIFFTHYENYVYFEVEHFKHIPTGISVTGKSIYGFNNKISSSILKFQLPDCAELTVYARENSKAVAFTANSNSFSDLKPIVELFKLNENLNKWLVPYNQALSFKLLQAKGVHSYNNMDMLLDTLYLKAKEKDVSYTFNEKLYPVNGKEVDFTFTKGILNISPKKATYNKKEIEDSDININFNQEQVTLDLDLKIKTRLDQDVIDIAEAYNITLPVYQDKGKTDAHVQLHINLETEDAYANGQFFIKDSDIKLAGVPYHITNTAIRLNKTYLSLDSGTITYKDIIKAKAHGGIELKELIGDFYFDTKEINFPLTENYTISLTQQAQFHLQYTKDKEKVLFDTTHWKIDDHNLTFLKNEVEFAGKFIPIVKINNLQVKAKNIADADLFGVIDISRDFIDVDAQLYNINHATKKINIRSDDTIDLNYRLKKDITRITIKNQNTFYINRYKLAVDPTHIRFKNDFLDIYGAPMTVDNDISSKVSIHHKFGTKRALLNFEYTHFLSEDTLFIGPKIKVDYRYKKGSHFFSADQLAIKARMNTNNDTSLVIINDISKMHPYSPFLKRYFLREGDAELKFYGETMGIKIDLKNYRPLFSLNGKNITRYKMKGTYRSKVLHLDINKKHLELNYRHDFNVRAENIDFNLHPMLDFISESSQEGKKSTAAFFVRTKDCNISLGDSQRTVITDTMEIDIVNDKILGKLFYKEGGILFQSKGRKFTAYGNGLDDKFMNKLFKFSTFEGGNLSFHTYGNFNDYSTLMYIKDSRLKDYTVLNNTLAFFNTIPALVTFSVPGYSSNGLAISKAYVSFDMNDSIATVKDSKIESKELIITGKGTSDLNNDTIDMTMQVKTDLGSSAKNIPLVGYIIFGEESVSTTVHIHGDLKDPEVDNSAARSVIAAPYNIIKRTLLLPYKLFNDLFSDDENSSD